MPRKKSPKAAPADFTHWELQLQRHLRDGGLYRDDPDDIYAGQCGGIVARRNGSEGDYTPFCQRAAGWGTSHSGLGYCRHHEDQLGVKEALPPWTGPMTDEQWRILTGGHERVKQEVGFSKVRQKTEARWEDFLRDSLTEDEWHVYKSMPTDPVTVLDTEIRLNRIQAMRLHREVKRLNMLSDMDPGHVGGGSIGAEMVRTRSALIATSGVLARLMEVRARLSEIASDSERSEWMQDFLSGMSHEEFIGLSANPSKLMGLLNRSNGVEA